MTYSKEKCERKDGERNQILPVERLTRMFACELISFYHAFCVHPLLRGVHAFSFSTHGARFHAHHESSVGQFPSTMETFPPMPSFGWD